MNNDDALYETFILAMKVVEYAMNTSHSLGTIVYNLITSAKNWMIVIKKIVEYAMNTC